MSQRRSSTAVLSLLVVLLAALTGCGDDDEPAVTDDTDGATTTTTLDETTTSAHSATTTEAGAALGQSCSTDRYEMRYPDDWFTAEDAEFACTAFHPEPFQVQRGTEHQTAMFTSIDPVEYDRVVSSTDDGGTAEVLEREDLTVDGSRATRFELRSTGEGLYPEGTLYTFYAVDLDGETMIVSAVDGRTEDLAYEELQRILHDMTESLTILR